MAEIIVTAWTVYGLRDPIDGATRYIGQTSNSLKQRIRAHRFESKNSKGTKNEWFAEVESIGRVVEIFQIVCNAVKDIDEIEQIKLHIDAGCELFNLTGGGSGLMNCTESTKLKLSRSTVDRFKKDSERIKTSETTKTAMADPVTREKLSDSCATRWASQAERDLQSARTARFFSDPINRAAQAERRAKMSNEQVMEARAARRAGVPLATLCERFGLAAGSMSMLCNGKTFKHLPL